MFNSEEYFDDVSSYIIDGKLDKSNAPLTWYRLKSEFNLPIGWIEFDEAMYIAEKFVNPHWSIKNGEVIAFGSMQYQDNTKIRRSNIVVRGDGEEIQFVSNTRKFFDINHKLFENITLQIQRENKLNKIL